MARRMLDRAIAEVNRRSGTVRQQALMNTRQQHALALAARYILDVIDAEARSPHDPDEIHPAQSVVWNPVASAFTDAIDLLREPPAIKGDAVTALTPVRERAKATQYLVDLLRPEEPRPLTSAEQALWLLVQHGRGVEEVGGYVFGRASAGRGYVIEVPEPKEAERRRVANADSSIRPDAYVAQWSNRQDRADLWQKVPDRAAYQALGATITNALIPDFYETDAEVIRHALKSAVTNSFAFQDLDLTTLLRETNSTRGAEVGSVDL
jgi:hypothetical protein